MRQESEGNSKVLGRAVGADTGGRELWTTRAARAGFGRRRRRGLGGCPVGGGSVCIDENTHFRLSLTVTVYQGYGTAQFSDVE
jgi:hypothetical protein